MLDGKVCIVAGGGHGLGEATAIHLGKLGATVVINDLGTDPSGESRDEEPAAKVAEEVEAAGGTAMPHFGDVTSLEYTQELVDDTVDEYGRIDGVANFAGILNDSFTHSMSGDEWDSVINVHLRGHFALLRNVAAHWRQRSKDEGLDSQRSFLAMTSRSALGNPGQINYSAAKSGIMGMTWTAAQELSRYNVRMNALMPTAFTRLIEEIPEEQRPFTEEEMPPEKVAPMVGYMMSDAAEDINGCILRAAGDAIGLVSEPSIDRLAFQEGGWTAEEIADRFRDTVGNDVNLDRTQ
ncbi:SDR family NAD(P)-dependent oxidoreductase [Natronomonas amylolytica]|uniref:SDR family NAD(P)-dependent oxidoreductase n=1 Tax=Natronomonas amylolytica TaxID=3108498 RepID=UPI00300A0462